jgi:hypothetical protein
MIHHVRGNNYRKRPGLEISYEINFKIKKELVAPEDKGTSDL